MYECCWIDCKYLSQAGGVCFAIQYVLCRIYSLVEKCLCWIGVVRKLYCTFCLCTGTGITVGALLSGWGFGK